MLPVVLAAALVLGAGAYGLSALLGSSGNAGQPAQSLSSGGSHSTSPSGGSPSTPPAGGSPSSPTGASAGPVNWLGMQVQNVQPGVVVVETVSPGSPADAAGLEPGDVIVAINNQPINGTGDIGAAIRGLHSGDQVQLEISRGSSLFTTPATLASPPSTP